MKFWARQQQRAIKIGIRHLSNEHRNLQSNFHIAHPNITKIELKQMVVDNMIKRVNRIEIKQKRHRKK